MDWILILAVSTFVLVAAFLVWNKISVKRHQETGGKTDGLGGPNDPIAGATPGIRDGEEIRASLDAATARDAGRTP